MQQTACGYGARTQAFNYSHVGYGDTFFFHVSMIMLIPGYQFKASSLLHYAEAHREEEEECFSASSCSSHNNLRSDVAPDFWAAGQICMKCTSFLNVCMSLFSAAHQSQCEIVRMSRSLMSTSFQDTFVFIPLKVEVKLPVISMWCLPSDGSSVLLLGYLDVGA